MGVYPHIRDHGMFLCSNKEYITLYCIILMIHKFN